MRVRLGFMSMLKDPCRLRYSTLAFTQRVVPRCLTGKRWEKIIFQAKHGRGCIVSSGEGILRANYSNMDICDQNIISSHKLQSWLLIPDAQPLPRCQCPGPLRAQRTSSEAACTSSPRHRRLRTPRPAPSGSSGDGFVRMGARARVVGGGGGWL